MIVRVAPLFAALLIAMILAGSHLPARGQAADAPAVSRLAADDEEARAANARTQQLLDRPMPRMDLQKASLRDSIDYFRDLTDANLVIDWKGLEAAKVSADCPITFSGRNIKFSDVLSTVLSQAGAAGFVLCDGVIYITDADTVKKYPDHKLVDLLVLQTAPSALSDEDQQSLKMLCTVLPSARFDQTSLSNALDYLRDLTDARITVNWHALPEVKIDRDSTVTASVHNVRFNTFLSLILRQMGGDVVYTIDHGTILISTRADLEKSGNIPATMPATVVPS